MAIDDELDAVLTASEQIVENGVSDVKCPRCGEGFVMTSVGTSFTVECKTDGCVKEDFRGI